MRSFLKQHFHKSCFALLFLLSFLFLSGRMTSGSAVSVENGVIVLWEDSISSTEATRRLSLLCPKLRLTDHLDDLSVCESLSPNLIDVQLQRLNRDAAVRIAEPNHTTVLCDTGMHSMEYFNTQWALHNTGNYTYYINQIPIHRSSTIDIDINLPEAYDLLPSHATNRTVTVAIIDTGVDISHPALKNHIWVNENEIPMNGIDDDGNGYIDDYNGWDFYNNDSSVCHYKVSDFGQTSANPEDNDTHGTHCAGIIAATEGIYGVAGGIDIRILPLKIHGGSGNSGSVADAIKAIKYAQAAGADICNMSWGTTLYSEALETVMRESDMLFVVAAGNYGNNNNSAPLYPASYLLDNMISVAYVTQYGSLASDSNYGSSTVDIAAPGQDIYSTTIGGGYHYLSGTSMAAPIVSGVSALLYACGDLLYPQNVKELLLQTIKPLDSLTGYVRYPGIPDAAAALQAADFLVSDTIAPTLRPTTRFLENSIVVQLHPEDLGGSGVRVLSYAFGSHSASYFCHGTVGQTLSDSTLYLQKAGIYTFYVSDYAGNETTLIYTVKDDTTAPSLSASYKENSDGTFTVTVTANDADSGIKRLRYLNGVHTFTAFLAAGQDLFSQTGYTFIAPKEDLYTLYAMDYRGNKTTLLLDIKKRPAEQLFLNVTERTLTIGDTFSLVPFVLPLDATDFLSFSVTDETLLYAAPDGTITALMPGTAEVTISTSGGIKKTCIFHIVPPSDVVG